MFEIAGLATGLIGSIGKIFSRGRANREMNKLLAKDPTYKENPIAGQRMSLAQTLLNARMPGAASVERNIYGSQANATAGATRAASDGSQLLATAGNIQGNTNAAFNKLGMAEADDYQRRFGNLVGAQEGVINEQDKVFNDRIRRFGNETQIKGAQSANNAANWGDVSNLGFSLMDFGAGGGFQNFFNNGGGQNNPPSVTRAGLDMGGQLPRTYRRFQ